MSFCKFYKEEEYVSYDSGETWTAMGVYRKGDLIEYDSEDCGYVPPTPTGNTKFSASYSGGETYSAACDGNTTLTTATTKPSGYEASAMTEAIVGDCVTSIGDDCFLSCSGLTSVTIPDSVTSIGGSAFEYCSGLTSVTIPDSVTSIGKWAFHNCHSLTSIDIPNSVTSIGNYAFNNCSGLTSVTIPNSVTNISYNAFQNCSSLTSVTLPSGVTSIAAAAFELCSGLTSITCLATTPPSLGNNAFNKTNNCPIYVPAASVDAYKTDGRWSGYASRIQAIP